MGLAILTRDDVAAYARALAPLEVIALPVTRTAPPPDPAALARALAEPHDAVLVASARAARCVVGTTAEVWAVGPATAALFPAAHTPDVADGASLARALLAARGPVRVLVPRAEEGREDAVAILRAAGAHVIEAIAYRTVAVPAGDPSLAAGLAALSRADVIVVFAPSQVAALAAVVSPRPLAGTFVAIGPTTAAALRDRGIEPAVAAAPTPEGIANAVASVYPARR